MKPLIAFILYLLAGVNVADAQLSLQMLIVGGGGGGGRNAGSYSSGGGGASAGEVVYATTTANASYVYTIAVGAGGNGYRYSPSVTQTGGGSSLVSHSSSSWTASGGNAGGNATSGSSSGAGGTSVNSDGSGAGGRGGIYNNGDNNSGWPVAGGNGTSSYSSWGAVTGTGELSGSTYWYGGGGAGGNWGGQLGSGVRAAGLGGGGMSNTDALANTGGGGGGANSNATSGNNLPGGNGGSGLVIVRYVGSQKASGGTVVTSGGYTYHVFTSSSSLTMFTTLPISWQSFTAVQGDGAVLLDWSVSDASNVANYVLQRSLDGLNFTAIAHFPAQRSGKLETYSYSDAGVTGGGVYYRILQTDDDGLASYSKTVFVAGNRASSIRVFPNPVRDRLNIDLPADVSVRYVCTISNAGGAAVLKRTLAAGLNTVDMQAMLPGMYFVVVWKNGVCVHVEKVMK